MKIKNILIDRSFFAISCLLIFAITSGYFPKVVNGQRLSTNIKTKEKQGIDATETSALTVSGIENFKNQKSPKIQNLSIAAGVDRGDEIEPNNTSATATALTGSDIKIRGNIFPNGDLDYFSFSANAGDRVYATVMTSFSASANTDSQLRIFASDGVTELELDEDDGSLGALSSSIAGVVIPSAGTYYAQVKHLSATGQLRPYDLYLKVQSGSPTPEVEPNDTSGTANPLPGNRWVSGARNPAAATEQDWFSFTLNAGDTVYLGLDLDPERDNVQWNGRLGFALFGDADNQIITVDDASVGSAANPLSEALIMTVKNAGTYYAFVDSATAATGGPTATYNLSVSVIPRVPIGVNCTTYTSTNVPQSIGPGATLTSSTLTVPGNPRIASARVLINATHAKMADMDVNLRSPAGNNNGLVNDIGAGATGGQTMMDLILDDYAGVPFVFTVLRPLVLKPELNYRLDWFNGENAGGVWTLDIRDDVADTSGGTLNSWGLEICEQPAPVGTLIYSEDFEPSNGGYTHTGAADEWEYGTPATVATTTANPVAEFSTCNSGTGCWKTDLDGTYEVSSNQDLNSIPLNLTQYIGTINLSWAMKYQMESATFDHARVIVTNLDNPADTRTVWEWNGATMTVGVGSPAVNIGESAGWGIYNANISDFAGKRIQITFHIDTDTSVNFGGMAIDDVQLRNLGPTAGNVGFSGRVLNYNGSGIANAKVAVTDLYGATQTATTNNFGYYHFENIEVGQSYALDVSHRGYRFNPQYVSVFDEIKNADVIALPR